MTAYEELLQEAEDNNIEVLEFIFKSGIKGLYADNVIALNKSIENINEKKCTLREELEHAYMSAGHILNLKSIQDRKQERIARARSYEKLVPLELIIKASIECCTNIYEAAEYAGVTEKFLKEAIDYYQGKYGLYKEIGNYCIYFKPLTVCRYKYD